MRFLISKNKNWLPFIIVAYKNGVPRSTFYTWLKPYQIGTTPFGHIVSANEFIKMKQRIGKLEQKIEVLQKVDCTVSSSLQDKLQELSKLYAQYSVHTFMWCTLSFSRHFLGPHLPQKRSNFL
jgi:hypothetical protein